jgi:ubiquinone/menaquinone biosynthesis C-methylase UbiE
VDSKEQFQRRPFGAEYSESPRWGCFERLYIRFFGVVDLPSRMRARIITEALRNIPWEKMIDFGCGTGTYSFYFSRSRGAHVCGVDIEQNRISECAAINRKLRRESLEFVCRSGLGEKSEFESGSADVVLAVEVLQCLPDTRAGLREIQRVLKSGGHLIAHVPVLGYRRTHETMSFDDENIGSFIREAGLELVSVTRVFGRAADFLAMIFSRCIRSRLLTAFLFPPLLLASLACGGKDPRGSYRLIVARKS